MVITFNGLVLGYAILLANKKRITLSRIELMVNQAYKVRFFKLRLLTQDMVMTINLFNKQRSAIEVFSKKNKCCS
ncbi:hypothetical protein HMPREF2130_03695 [Oligella urethralis DNF00040]|uniref:Uncharacterized protein n=1 Tax=Oligella urethralis DNF00040 TaxID=1401065 RepID=A0A095Z9H6_9BURK|nr:hypothetical protein HMPREF2130_03695 [Oligella urethralis DNF00040]